MKREQSIRLTALTLSGLMGISILSAPIAARASEEGRRNTAYALGAVAFGLLLSQHHSDHHNRRRYEQDNCGYIQHDYMRYDEDQFRCNHDDVNCSQDNYNNFEDNRRDFQDNNRSRYRGNGRNRDNRYSRRD